MLLLFPLVEAIVIPYATDAQLISEQFQIEYYRRTTSEAERIVRQNNHVVMTQVNSDKHFSLYGRAECASFTGPQHFNSVCALQQHTHRRAAASHSKFPPILTGR